MTDTEGSEADDTRQHELAIPPASRRHWIILVGLGLAVLLLAYLFVPRTNAYSVSANTEYVEFAVTDPEGATSSLIERMEILDPLNGQVVANAHLHFEPAVTVLATRRRAGPLLLSFEADADRTAASLLLADGSQIPLSVDAGLRIPLGGPGEAFLLAVDGAVTIGTKPGPRVDTVLLDGTAAILEEQPFWGERFLLDRADIPLGAVLEFKKHGGNQSQAAEAKVLLHVDSRLAADGADAIRVTANAAADEVEISRYGAADYSIRPSPWARMVTDPLAQFLLTALAVLASMAALADYVEGRLPRRNNIKNTLEAHEE